MLFVAIAVGVAGWLAHGRAPWWRSWGFIALALALAASAFVVPQRYLRIAPAKTRPMAGTASVEIIAPADGTVVGADSLTMAVDLRNAQLVATSRSVGTGKGHLHVSVDGSLLTMAGGLQTRVDLRPFKAGTHTLTVELVAADHGPFLPRVRDAISFVKEVR
jgi:hypothetical protein